MTITADDLEAPERRTPVVSPGPLVPAPDFGPTDRLRGWAATAVIAALAALTRFMNLGSPTDAGTPIFDEKHYAPQAWQLLHNFGVEDNPGFGLVVHPPLGKQLMAAGEAVFGYTGLGWRFSGAVCGVILAALVMRIVRRISRSTLIGTMAGVLMIVDGVSFHSGSREGDRVTPEIEPIGPSHRPRVLNGLSAAPRSRWKSGGGGFSRAPASCFCSCSTWRN